MKSLKEKRVDTALGIALICLFSTIYLAVSYYVIDTALQKFGDYYYNFYLRKQGGFLYERKEEKGG